MSRSDEGAGAGGFRWFIRLKMYNGAFSVTVSGRQMQAENLRVQQE